MSDVALFLQAQGLKPTPVRFLETDILLGESIESAHFRLIYRQEQDRLILCDFTARGNDSHAVIALLNLLRRIIKAVPVLNYIDAMILPAPNNRELDLKRQRLSNIMISEGAKPVKLSDGVWLRYSCKMQQL